MEKVGIFTSLLGGIIAVLLGISVNIGTSTQVATVIVPSEEGSNDTSTTTDEGTTTHNEDTATSTETGASDDPVFPAENTTSPADEEETLTSAPNISCPFLAKPDRTIVDFTHDGLVPLQSLVVRANGTVTAAIQTWSEHNIESGVYGIQLASLDTVVESGTGDIGEQWLLELRNEQGVRIVSTHETRDIPDEDSHTIDLVERDIDISQAIHTVVARHAAYPDEKPQLFAPLCAAFDRIGASKESDTTASQEDTSVATVHLYATCPIPERENRVLVDFTRGGTVSLESLFLLAAGEKKDARLAPQAQFLPAGTYVVRQASYQKSGANEHTEEQSWSVVLFDGTKSIVKRLPGSRDVPAWEEEFVSLLDEQVKTERATLYVGAVHNMYPHEHQNPVAPLCVSFDAIPSIEIEEQTETMEYMGKPEIVSTETILAPVPVQPTKQDNTAAVEQDKTGKVSKTKQENMPQDEAVEVLATAVGVSSDTGRVIIPAEVLERRQQGVVGLDATPFELLQKSGVAQRERIVQKIIKAQNVASPTDSSGVVASDGKKVGDTSQQLAQNPPPSFERLIEDPANVDGLANDGDVEVTAKRHFIKKGSDPVVTLDTDGDGITDIDEEYLYETDPRNPFTGGSTLTDGERLLMGLNPATDDYVVVPVESAKETGIVDHDLFTVETLTLDQNPNHEGETTLQTEVLRVTGFTEPFAFVTLYIYSTPIILTVRADESGRFKYELDKALEDGSHELYVASVSNTGRILAKSKPIPFVKTAEAIEITPVSSAVDPVEQSTQRILTMVLLLMLIVTIFAVVWLGVVRSKPGESVISEEHAPE